MWREAVGGDSRYRGSVALIVKALVVFACIMASLWFAMGQEWDKATFILVAGMVGMMVDMWFDVWEKNEKTEGSTPRGKHKER